VRVAHVVATFPPYLGGTGNVAYHNALELARLGHRVRVVTAEVPLPREWSDDREIAVDRLATPLRVGNAPLTPSLLWRLGAADIVHLHWPYMFGAELTWLACRLRRQPYVMTYHIDLIGRGPRAPLFAAYQATWAPRLIRDARAIFAVSLDHFQSTAAAPTTARVGTPVREIANGVDLARFTPGSREEARARLRLPADAKIALFVAALDRAHYYKGLSLLMAALRRLDDGTLVVVGDGDLRAGYEREATELGLAGRVRFAGAVGHDDLPEYYCAADATVLPSTHTESFGLVLVESLACGTPTVASDLPGVRSVVEHGRTGWLVPPGDVGQLADRLSALLSDPERRAAMGRDGRRRAELRYDWRRIARDLAAAYREALSA
jgi:glycosyltransferase involved in cell wall biosynthesis